MKLKAIVSAILVMAASAGASAAPSLQACEPMEILHSSTAGLGYSLSCKAGEWQMVYTGSVPAGNDPVSANYRLAITRPDGSNFIQRRATRLPSPAMLGQVLAREAVLLDDGDLALRECPDYGCTLYRPLGVVKGQAAAAVTVSPEVKRIAAERLALVDRLAQKTSELEQSAAQVAELTGRVATLSALAEQSASSREQLGSSHSKQLAELKDQQAADISGLLNSHAAELARVTQASSLEVSAAKAAQAAAQDAAARLEQEIESLRAELEAVKAKEISASGDVAAHETVVGTLQSSLSSVKAELADALLARNEAAVRADIAERNARVAALARDKAMADSLEVQAVLTKVFTASETALQERDAALEKARAAEGNYQSAVEGVTQYRESITALHNRLDQAENEIAVLRRERETSIRNIAVLQQSADQATSVLADAQRNLEQANARAVAATAALDSLKAERGATADEARKANESAEGSLSELNVVRAQAQGLIESVGEFAAKLAAVVLERDTATAKVAALEADLTTAEQNLAAAKAASATAAATLVSLEEKQGVTSSYQQAAQAVVEQTKAELVQATAQANELQSVAESLRVELATTARARDEAFANVRGLEEVVSQHQAALTGAQSKAAGLEASLVKAQAEVGALKQELDSVKAKTASVESEIASATTELATVKSQLEEQESNLAKEVQGYDTALAERDQLTSCLEAALADLAAEEAKVGTLRADVARLQKDLYEVSSTQATLQLERDEALRKADAAEAAYQVAVGQIEGLQSALAAAKTEVAQGQGRFDAAEKTHKDELAKVAGMGAAAVTELGKAAVELERIPELERQVTTLAQERDAAQTRATEADAKLAQSLEVLQDASSSLKKVEVLIFETADKNEALTAERDQALARAQRVDDANFELSAKLEATVLTRDLAMQTAAIQGGELDALSEKLTEVIAANQSLEKVVQTAAAEAKTLQETAASVAAAHATEVQAAKTAKQNADEAHAAELTALSASKTASEAAHAEERQALIATHAAALAAQAAELQALREAGAAAEAARIKEVAALKAELEKAKVSQSAAQEQVSVLNGNLRKLNGTRTELDAYKFIAGDLVEQHNAQVALLKKTIPGVDFSGVLKELAVPTVTTLLSEPELAGQEPRVEAQ